MNRAALQSIQDKLFSGQPIIMGVLNVTPDSFSEHGRYFDSDKAKKAGMQMMEDGADIIDIGGESTRPGAEPVSIEEELRRVLPAVEELSKHDIPVSIDTYHAKTMESALSAGACMINDVTALSGDAQSLAVVAEHECLICLMHMQGTPQNMQKQPFYEDVVEDIQSYLRQRVQICADAGIDRKRLIIDPGIGFGKTLEHNLRLLNNLEEFCKEGLPVLLGISRKSFIEKICGPVPAEQRLPGTIAGNLWGLQKGVSLFRVHDVKEMKQAIDVWQAIDVIEK